MQTREREYECTGDRTEWGIPFNLGSGLFFRVRDNISSGPRYLFRSFCIVQIENYCGVWLFFIAEFWKKAVSKLKADSDHTGMTAVSLILEMKQILKQQKEQQQPQGPTTPSALAFTVRCRWLNYTWWNLLFWPRQTRCAVPHRSAAPCSAKRNGVLRTRHQCVWCGPGLSPKSWKGLCMWLETGKVWDGFVLITFSVEKNQSVSEFWLELCQLVQTSSFCLHGLFTPVGHCHSPRVHAILAHFAATTPSPIGNNRAETSHTFTLV